MSASFVALFSELRRSRPRSHPVWDHNAKLDARALVAGLGVRLPALHLIAAEPRGIPEPSGPVVVKPNNGCVALGVLPLLPVEDGWRGAFSGQVAPWAAWMRKLDAIPRRKTPPNTESVGGPWLVEEFVGGGPAVPDDWKCYVIGGRVGIVAQMRRAPGAGRGAKPALCQWSREWERVHATPHTVYALPAPRFGPALIEAAERIARALPAPFVRIDLYEDERGPLFGEITPEPGGSHRFNPEWDRKLGEMWGTSA